MKRAFSILTLLLIVAAAVAAAWFHRENPLVHRAAEYAEEISTASAATYVTLRTLNAVLSTAQEVEVSGSALIVSGTAQPLRILEPVDDTIERIASVVFALMIATGILSLSVGPLGAVGAGMIAVAGTLWIIDRILGPRDVTGALAQRLIWYGAFFLVALPLAFVLSDLLAEYLTGEVLTRHEAVIAEITASVGGAAPAGDGGWWESLRDTVDAADRYQELAQNIWARADELIASYVSMLSVFIFRIFLLPALIVGAFFVLTRFFARRT